MYIHIYVIIALVAIGLVIPAFPEADNKKMCKSYGGNWEDGDCKNIGDKDRTAHYEDDSVDENKKDQDAILVGYDKEDCKADGGEWEDGECETNCYVDGEYQEPGKEDDACG